MAEHLISFSAIVDVGTDKAEEISIDIERLINEWVTGAIVQANTVTQIESKDFYPGMDIAVAKDLLGEKLGSGEIASCPVCERTAKVYKRTIHSTMAASLIKLHNEYGQQWCRPIDVVGKDSPDLVKTRWWGLMEPQGGRRDDGSDRVGIWRLTGNGVAFVNGLYTVKKYVHVYDNRPLRTSGIEVGIEECLGKKFNYKELMTS